MKVLTLFQPYATLVVLGVKTIETRSWTTKHRGEIYIHAAAAQDSIGRARWESPKMLKYLDQMGCDISKIGSLYHHLQFGQIIGKVDIVGVTPASEYKEYALDAEVKREMYMGDLSEGRFAWMLEHAVKFPYGTFVRGQQRIWECKEPVLVQRIERTREMKVI